MDGRGALSRGDVFGNVVLPKFAVPLCEDFLLEAGILTDAAPSSVPASAVIVTADVAGLYLVQ